MVVSEDDAKWSAIRAMQTGRHVPANDYVGLYHRGSVVMSNTPDEVRDHFEPIIAARELGGHCLVNGLGLGMVSNAMLLAGAEHVTVVEISADVIALVGPHWTERWGERLDVVEADAFEYQPPRGTRYSYVWHDIWPTICADNLDEMTRLHRKYGRRCARQGSWARYRCERQRRAFW